MFVCTLLDKLSEEQFCLIVYFPYTNNKWRSACLT